jgi:retron-type reverse transcriptase
MIAYYVEQVLGVQKFLAGLKLVLEPIFEVDFEPCSYGFRPGRQAWDAIAEVALLQLPLV